MMAKKGFKDVKGAGIYGGMWSKPSPAETEEAEAHEEEQRPPVPSVKPERMQGVEENEEAIESSIEDEPIKKRGRGRPKMERVGKRTHFNLLLEPELMEGLIRAKALIELETGKRLTVTGLIAQIIADFIAAQGGAAAKGK